MRLALKLLEIFVSKSFSIWGVALDQPFFEAAVLRPRGGDCSFASRLLFCSSLP